MHTQRQTHNIPELQRAHKFQMKLKDMKTEPKIACGRHRIKCINTCENSFSIDKYRCSFVLLSFNVSVCEKMYLLKICQGHDSNHNTLNLIAFVLMTCVTKGKKKPCRTLTFLQSLSLTHNRSEFLFYFFFKEKRRFSF